MAEPTDDDARQRATDDEPRRAADIDALLDTLDQLGLSGRLRDAARTAPWLSRQLLDGLGTPDGQRGLHHLRAVAQTLGRLPPERLERALEAFTVGLETLAHPEPSRYDETRVNGILHRLADDELRQALGPLLSAADAASRVLHGRDGPSPPR